MARHQCVVADRGVFVAGRQAIFHLAGGAFVGEPGDRGRRAGRVDDDVGDGRRCQVGRLGREGERIGRHHAVAHQVAGVDRDRDGRVRRVRCGGCIGDGQIVRRAGQFGRDLLAVNRHEDRIEIDADARVLDANGHRSKDVDVGAVRRGRAGGDGGRGRVGRARVVADEHQHGAGVLDEVALAVLPQVGQRVIARLQRRLADVSHLQFPRIGLIITFDRSRLGPIPREKGCAPVHSDQVSRFIGGQIQIIRQGEVVGNRVGPVAVHMETEVVKVRHRVVHDRIRANQCEVTRDAAGGLACVAVLVDHANLEFDAGLINDVGNIPLNANFLVDPGQTFFRHRSNVIDRAARYMRVYPLTHLTLRPPVIATEVVPVTEDAIVVVVVAVVVGVEFDVAGIADFGRQLNLVVGADIQHTAIGQVGVFRGTGIQGLD